MVVEMYEYLTGPAMPMPLELTRPWTEAVGDTDEPLTTYSEADLLLEVV